MLVCFDNEETKIPSAMKKVKYSNDEINSENNLNQSNEEKFTLKKIKNNSPSKIGNRIGITNPSQEPTNFAEIN
jgi:hypothetical protein